MADAASLREEHPLHAALLLAILVHAAVILGVTFEERAGDPPPRTIEVTLAQWNDPRVGEADFLAQHDQQGSGDAAHAVEMQSTSESPWSAEHEMPVPALSAASARAAANVDEVTRLDATELRVAPPEQFADSAAPTNVARRDYLDVATEVATLNARLAAEQAAEARGPRVRRITSVSTRTAVEAYYLQSWRREIEQLGNLNFPEDGEHNRLYGSLRLLVTLEAGGALHEVSVLESSGRPLLDQAAIRIVRLAAPFPPFPPEMRAEMDRLEIVRTWQFRRTGKAGSFAM